jgi:hypothetical protein
MDPTNSTNYTNPAYANSTISVRSVGYGNIVSIGDVVVTLQPPVGHSSVAHTAQPNNETARNNSEVYRIVEILAVGSKNGISVGDIVVLQSANQPQHTPLGMRTASNVPYGATTMTSHVNTIDDSFQMPHTSFWI